MNQLSLIRQGGLLADLDDAVREVTRAVVERGKPGAVTITLRIRPATTNGTNVIVSDEVKTKLPKLQTGETILFTSVEGDLSESDPRQGKLDLNPEVDTTTGEIITTTFRKVNNA